MKLFLKKIMLFSLLFFVLFFLSVQTSTFIVEQRPFENWNTESNLLIIKPDRHYDLLIMGNSHARNFSRHGNHFRVERILKKKILNLGKSAGVLGVNDYYPFLYYCLSLGDSFDTILFTVSSPMIYANKANLASNTFEDEPLKWNFLFQYILILF